MMKTGFAVFLLLVVGALSGTAAIAQGIRDVGPPAEFPPSSYTDRQYVDSRGCVYVRAGFDGNVTWVPRVTRSRTALCGYQPTALGSTAAQEAPVVADAPDTPAPPQDPEVVASSPAPAARPAPARVVKAPTPAPQPTRVVRAPAPQPARAPQPTRVVRAAPAPAPVPAPQPETRTGAAAAPTAGCPGLNGISARYVGNSGRNLAVRCGPQKVSPYGEIKVIRGGSAGTFRRAPVSNPVAAPKPVVPAGFRPAWTDDRLNPHRGKQTLNGALQTALVWTQTVPRRLIDRRSGKDVTAEYKYLVYPYTDYNTLKQDLKGGTHVVVQNLDGERFVVARSDLREENGTIYAVRRATVPQGGTLLSTKSAAVATTPQVAPVRRQAAATSPRYVKVGTFATAELAASVAARLRGQGLPIRTARLTRGNDAYRVLMAGPFTSQTVLTGALSEVRGSGFPAATVR